MKIGKPFYSNCLIEAIKAKIRNPAVKIKVALPPKNTDVICPHFYWVDDKYKYDFEYEGSINFILAWTIHKGRLRKLDK